VSDNRLNVSVNVTGSDASQAQITRLTQQVNNLRDALANLHRSNVAGSPSLVASLNAQLVQAEAQLKRLQGQYVQNYSALEAFSTRAIAAMRGQAEAVKGEARALDERDRLLRAGAAGGRVLTSTTQDVIAATTGLGRASSLTKAQVEEMFGGAALSAKAYKRELEEVLLLDKRVGMMGALQSIQPRRYVSLFDELSRNQRGAAISTIGATIKDAGLGGAGAAAGLGGLVAIGGAAAILHYAENMAKWAEQVRNASVATGMSIPEYSKLQGALELTGMKADASDMALRTFAKNIEEAMANPASRSAKALHALGVLQEEIVVKGNNTMAMFERVIGAFGQFRNSATSAAAGQALFGRGFEAMGPAVNRGVEGLHSLMQEAEKLGITLDEKTAKKLAETGEKVNILGQQIRSQGIKSFKDWEDTINSVLDALSGMVSEFGVFSGMIGPLVSKVNSMTAAMGGLWGVLNPFAGLEHAIGNIASTVLPDGAGVTVPITQAPDKTSSPYSEKPFVKSFDEPKAKADVTAHKELSLYITEEQAKLTELRKQQQLYAQQQQGVFESQRIQAHISAADKDISPQKRAQEDYEAYRQAGQNKQAALQTYQAQANKIYDEMAAKAQETYQRDLVSNKNAAQEDLKIYQKVIGEKEAANIEFATQNQQINNEIASHFMEVVEAHQQAVQQVVAKWGAAFDQIGDKIETTLETAIKSAFEPMKPEYWWSSASGPHGQPLMIPHRIDPTTQLLSGLGLSIGTDLAKTIGSSLMTSVSKSIFGAGTASFGEGIAKMIGIGGPGGLFGTGLGAVSGVSEQATFATSVATFSAAVAAFAGATATAGASAGVSAAGGIGSAAGGAGGFLGFLGSIFGGGGSGLGVGGLVLAAAHGMVVPAFASGGISLPRSFGEDRVLGAFQPGEMTLPRKVSSMFQSMAENGGMGGGSSTMNLHFHGPADAPSMDRWFRNMMSSNPGVVRDFFRRNALTPRSL
jgi:hypothetical protein